MTSLFTLASTAHIFSGKLTDADNVDREISLPLAYNFDSANGYACTFTRSMADSTEVVGTSYEVGNVLLMRPKPVTNSTIKAKFPAVVLPDGACFKFMPAFLSGASTTSDGVIYKLIVHYTDAAGHEVWNTVMELPWQPRTKRREIVVDLSHLSHKPVGIELRVDSAATSTGDHAMWINPRIDVRPGANAKVWELKPVSLTVHERNEWDIFSGYGDEPYIGAIYFRSTINQLGSTKVKILDELQNLGSNVRPGRTLAVPDSAGLKIYDYGANTTVENSLLGVTVMGYIFIAMESDAVGKSIMRGKMKDAAKKLKTSLQTRIESSALALLNTNQVLDAIQRDVEGEPGSGGSSLGDDFLAFVARADDKIGQNELILVGLTEDTLRTRVRSYNPASHTNPVSALAHRNFTLDFKGKDAFYSIAVQINESNSANLV